MLEKGHLEAMQVATQNAVNALEKGNINASEIARKQMEAVRRINLASIEILEELDIKDIPIPTNAFVLKSNEVVFSAHSSDESVVKGTFGDQLKTYRKRVGLPQKILLEIAGISASSISRYEHNGDFRPRLTTVLNLIKALGLNREQANQFVKSVGYDSEVLNLPADQIDKIRKGTKFNK